MNRAWVYPYAMKSKAGTALAGALDVLKIKHENSKFKGKADRVVINWGNSQYKNNEIHKCRVINGYYQVANAINKINCLQWLQADGVRVPANTTSIFVAQHWLNQGDWVVVRNNVAGHDGAGAEVKKPGDGLDYAGLYTRYIPGQEYRVHVVMGDVYYQHRVPRNGGPDAPLRVGQGFGFNLLDEVPGDAREQSVAAIQSLGLDFGCTDVRVDKQGKAHVLEVNTAPEIFGVTLKRYARSLKKHLDI